MEQLSERNGTSEPRKAVVVCTDLSNDSDLLLQHAKNVCLRHGRNLQVVHVVDLSKIEQLPITGSAEYRAMIDERTKKLNAAVKLLHVPNLEIAPVLLVGNIVQRIRQFVDEVSAALVILGTAGKRGLNRWLLGSTAEAILRSVTCPVLVWGPNAHSYPNGPILFPTDFNTYAVEDISFASYLSRSLRVPLHCIHFLPSEIFDMENAIVRSVMLEAFGQLATDAEVPQEDTHFFIEAGDNLSSDIVSAAKRISASAIVLGVRRRWAMQSHMPSHETFKILATAPCPVYAISHAKEAPVI